MHNKYNDTDLLKMTGYIYKITNLTNNNIYIGQHKSPKFDEKYWGSGRLIYYALITEDKKC